MLKIVLILHIFLFGFSESFCQITKDDNDEANKNIFLVFSLNAFHNIKMQDANAVAKILANHIKKSYNSKYNFEVMTLEGPSELEKKAGDDFDCIILTTEEYLALKNKLPLEPYTTNYTDGSVGYKYHLVVNKNSSISDISQLKNETIYILAGQGQNTAFQWLNKLLREKKLPDQKKFFNEIVVDYKATNILLPVFFNKAKACIVTETSLDLLSELNPSIKNNIKILNTSDNILLGICCLNYKKKGGRIYNVLKEILPDLHKDEYGSQLLKLFTADKLVPFKEEYWQNYLKLFK